ATNQFTYTDNAITNEPASSGGTVAQVLGTVNSLTASGTSNNMVGVAKLTVVSPSLNAGTNHLFAVYTPTNFYLASTSAVSTVTVAVGTALTQNSLMSSAPTATYGAPLTFTATLKGVNGGAAPTGTVEFFSSVGGGTLLGSLSTPTTTDNSTATS